MAPKRKKKEFCKDTNSPFNSFFAELELKKFCPKKIFDILFIVEADENSTSILKNIINIASGYEDISCLTFITYEDVLELANNYEQSQFPASLDPSAAEICGRAREILGSSSHLPPSIMAQLVKLKLIEVMHRHFNKEMGKMEKRTALENELNLLIREVKKHIAEKPKRVADLEQKHTKSSTANVDKKRNKFRPEDKIVEEHYTSEDGVGRLIETENDIVFDDDIFNHVWFYVLSGFYDPEIIKQLTNVYRVPLTSIVKLDTKLKTGDNLNSTFKNFWSKVYSFFDSPQYDFFDNTMLMKFCADGSDFKELFQQLLYIIKSISDIKLQHLNYIRHLNVYQLENTYTVIPLQCLNVYERLMTNIPSELSDASVVIASLLEEVCVRVDEINISDKYRLLEEASAQSMPMQLCNCTNPCDIKELLMSAEKLSKINLKKRQKNTFLVQELDEINVILNSYKKCGSLVHDLRIDVLKNVSPLYLLKRIKNDFADIPHKHDVAPSTKSKTIDTETMTHFLYLMLFNTFKDEDCLELKEETELAENLDTYNKIKFWKSLEPTIQSDGFNSDQNTNNLYDVGAMGYSWKEKLSSTVLIQELFKLQNEYLYTDYKFEAETDTLMVQFSDHLDSFGLHTKIYEQSLTTPVCLRDFCKYIVVEKADWLKENKPPRYFRKSDEIEECRGVQNITKLHIFQEYRYLLDSKVKPDVAVEDVKADTEESTVTFEWMLDELANYPTSSKIYENCSKIKKESDFLAYDFGVKYFAVKGAKTVFSSHDNVKITVDNTRLISKEPNCTVNLHCQNNNLILHSNAVYLKEDYAFHMNLEDGTIISFILQDYKRKIKGDVINTVANTSNIMSDNSDNKNSFIDFIKNKTVTSVDENYFEAEIKGASEEIMSPQINIYSSLQQAVNESCSLYKINKNVNYVKRLRSKSDIPFRNILKQILHNSIRKKKENLTKKYMCSNGKKTDFKVKSNLDFRISLPNGLYLTCYSSQVKDNIVEIKQEFLMDVERNPTRIEEFRLFTREGYVLIKKIDGTITLLKSNGDTINFEKPDSKNENINQSNIKRCHCRTINDYRKKLNKMFNKNNENDQCYISRRAFLQTKKGYIINKDVLNILENSKVPYLRTTLLKFDGNRTCLENNKITQKRLFHTTFEQDFFTEEIYFERTDGFRSIFDKFGQQQVKFNDGTKITSSIHVAKGLVDGYVFVSLNFTYEHPHYATVVYNYDNSLNIPLNNEVILKREYNETLTVNIGSDLTTTVNTETVKFEKTCRDCETKFSCEFNVNPFSAKSEKGLDYSGEFVHAQDSYNKHFYVDYAGNCKRNENFISGPQNVAQCDHYKKCVYKKLFVVNRNLSGAQFWTENMVERKRNDENTHEIQDTALTLKTNVLMDYTSRFSNTKVLNEQLCLSKYKRNEEDQVFFTKFRALKQMMDSSSNKIFLQGLKTYFESNNVTNEVSKDLIKIIEKEENNFKCATYTVNKCKQTNTEDDFTKCRCKKLRRTMLEKVSRWQVECKKYKQLIRDKNVPNYFSSQFCQVLEK